MSSTEQTTRVFGGRYRLVDLLGRGGMADVFDAVDTRLGRPVAVKVLRPAMVARPEVRRRFEDEARAAASLSHPNVVAVYDTGEDDGVPWIVMERLSGETLADRLAAADGRPLPTDWVLRMAGDVCAAVVAAHAAGVLHRDIKPGNILFSDEGCAKVADFGIAKSVEAMGDATTAGLLLGTPRYLAPERIEGRPSSAASDVYAVGVVLYEALTGRPAFAGDTAVAAAYAVQHTTPTPLAGVRPDLPQGVCAVVERAMARDAADRFASARDLAQAIAAASAIDLRDAPDVDSTVVVDPGRWHAPTTGEGAPPTAVVGAGAWAATARPVHSNPPWWPRRRLIAILVAAVAVLFLLALLAARGRTTSSSASSPPGPSTTAAPSPVAANLRAVAARIDPAFDGQAAPQAAAGLRAVADKLDAGDGAGAASQATALAGQIGAWHVDRKLFDTATRVSLAALAEVPGADVSGATTTTAPARGRHKKHGNGGD